MRLPSSYKERAKHSPFQLFVAYLALKRHFTDDKYDFHKYQGRVNAKESSFETRKDKFFFYKLAKHRDPVGYLVANLSENPDAWIGQLIGDGDSETRFTEWKRRQESLTYCFKEELKEIGDYHDMLFCPENGQPELLKRLNVGMVSLDTVCLLQQLLNFVPYWDSTMELVLWEDQRRQIVKYLPFMEIDVDKMKKVLQEHEEALH